MIFNRVLSPTESHEALPHLQSLLTAERFHARGIVQSHEHIEQWHIEVDHAAQRWFAVDEHGHTHEYRDGTTFHDGHRVDHPTRISDELVGPLAAVFPERLRWWGELDGDFRPVLVERIGQHSILLTFEHGSDPSMRATMVVDTELGLVSRVMWFNSPYVILLDVELDRGIERLVPSVFPELEVLYPNY